jgi:pimeloyl-ACP methyl ester carboxylesterase
MSRLPERLICVIAVSASGLVDYPLWVKFLSGGMFTMSAGMGVEKFTRVYLKNMSKQTEVKNFVSGLEKPDMAVLSAVNKSLSDYSYLDTIKTSTVPMMYLVGEDDPDLVNMNKTIEAINENEGGLYDYGVLSGAGPLLNLDKFDEFNAILVNYLNVLC